MVFIYIQIDTINISYDVYGSGSPVVMLHGWGANKNTFKKVIEEIKSEHKVYSLDLPGFGDSEIGLPLNLYEVVEIIRKFIIALNITNPIIISHSYGTRLAIIYASKYEVSKLVLISAAGIKTKLKLSKRLNILIYKTAKRLGINLKSGSSDYRNADNVKRRMLVDAVNRDLQKEMKLIKCPTLFLSLRILDSIIFIPQDFAIR